MGRFRLLIAVLFAAWVLPAPAFLMRTSSSGTAILGRYTLRYFLLLVAYCAIPAALAALAWRPPARLIDRLMRPLRWLQRRPLLLSLTVYGFLEVWYLLQRTLRETRFFGIGRGYTSVLTGAALLLIAAAAVLIFAGRGPGAQRTLAANLALSGAAVFAAFTAFSLLYALVVRRDSYLLMHRLWPGLHRRDPVLSYSDRPDVTGLDLRWPEGQVTRISTDVNGFRNPGDVSAAAVVGIGDSFLAALAVPDAQTWSAVLSRELGVEVANYGIIGYQMWQYNLVLDRAVRRGDHELVIYAIFANDLRDDAEQERDVSIMQRWELWPRRSPLTFTAHEFLRDSPAYQIAGLFAGPPSPAAGRDRPQLAYGLAPKCLPLASYDAALQPLIAERLDRAIALADEIGVRILFVTLPSKESVYAEELLPVCDQSIAESVQNERQGFRFVCRYLSERGQVCVDMTESFRAAADRAAGPIYFPVDIHWNAEGNRVFARGLADAIRQYRLLP